MMKVLLVQLFMLVLVVGGSAHAAKNGSSPNGKPFEHIQEQLYDLRIITETLEEQVVENSNRITDLQSKSIMLENAILNQVGNINNLTIELDDVNAQISLLQVELDEITNELAFKQYIISGSCPPGEAVREVFVDGSVACENVSEMGLLKSFRVINVVTTKSNSTTVATAFCPSGTTLTGGGFKKGFQTSISQSNQSGNTWLVHVKNNSIHQRYIYAMATCSYIEN